MKQIYLLLLVASISSCTQEEDHVVSSGLKIFSTPETHIADFANDPTLTGANGIEKADDFCNKSSAKPNNSAYKALLVDGINRDPVSLTDWVLQPDTDYYRNHNNILIGRTSNLSIFSVTFVALSNSVSNNFYDEWNYRVFTGIADIDTFATTGTNCTGWSTTSSSDPTSHGDAFDTGYSAFVRTISTWCSMPASLYCVEQP